MYLKLLTFKTARIFIVILKNSDLDTNTLQTNIKPPSFSEVLEKAAFMQIKAFVKENDIVDMFEFGYRLNPSTDHPHQDSQ